MKALIISNIAKTFTSFTYNMSDPLQELGFEDIHVACNFNTFKGNPKDSPFSIHHIDFNRNPFHPENIKAFVQLYRVMEKEKFDLVHCNTPIGGILGRLCADLAKVPTIVYTAHGFHFYKGAPFLNRTLYKSVEKYLAKKTDAIITMNNEDFDSAQYFKLRNRRQNYFFVNGVGIDIHKFRSLDVNREDKRKELGLNSDDIMLIAMGDLIKRKNYQASIRAIAKACNPNLHFFICGSGPLEDELISLAQELNVKNQVHFLGFRSDVGELLKCSDIFLFTSYQEGLPRSLMEAMSIGLPCVCSNIRGNIELIDDGIGGYLLQPDNIDGFSEALNELSLNKDLRTTMGKSNLDKVKLYSIDYVKKQMRVIYKEIIG